MNPAITPRLLIARSPNGVREAHPRFLGNATASSANFDGVKRSTDLEDELSLEMARLAQAMGIGSLGQAIELDLGSAHHARLI